MMAVAMHPPTRDAEADVGEDVAGLGAGEVGAGAGAGVVAGATVAEDVAGAVGEVAQSGQIQSGGTKS